MSDDLPQQSLDENYRVLCGAVGHLFISFSRLEGTMSSMLRLHLANNFDKHLDQHESVVLSSAIYGSMRFKASKDTMRRLAKAEGVPEETNEFLDDLFGQIGHIENLRDKLAHQVTIASNPTSKSPKGYWQVSDQTVTRDLKNIKVYVFDTASVFSAAADLVTAYGRIGNNKQNKRLFENLSLEPISWLYKSSMLKHVRLGTARTL